MQSNVNMFYFVPLLVSFSDGLIFHAAVILFEYYL